MTDIMDNPFDPFADAVEATLQGFRTEIAGLRTELSSALTEVRSLKSELETRSVPLEPVIDVEAIATRAAALVPTPEHGKDAVVDYAKITEEVRGIVAPMVTAEVQKIPAPSVDLDAIARNAAALIPKPKDGEDGQDGIATREELDTLVEQRVEARFADVQARTWIDTYQGTFDPKQTYSRGSTVTWDGSLWGAFSDTNKQPGIQDSGWKLITKRGRDGRDKR